MAWALAAPTAFVMVVPVELPDCALLRRVRLALVRCLAGAVCAVLAMVTAVGAW